jgi:hypothetical protein
VGLHYMHKRQAEVQAGERKEDESHG